MRRLNKQCWPHKVTLTNATDGVEDWLFTELGQVRQRWNAVYNFDKSDYYFRSHDDAVWFALKWIG